MFVKNLLFSLWPKFFHLKLKNSISLEIFSIPTVRIPHKNRGLVDVSDIFYIFCSGEGKGESKAPGGGGDFY